MRRRWVWLSGLMILIVLAAAPTCWSAFPTIGGRTREGARRGSLVPEPNGLTQTAFGGLVVLAYGARRRRPA